MALRPQHSNTVVSNFLLYLDNKILIKGGGFNNVSSYFYDTDNIENGYYTYASPYGPFISDSSIVGANIISGVYLDNTFITTGQSGLFNINYDKGRLYFTGEITNASTRISGNYSIKDFNVKLTTQPEEQILFETKHNLKPKIYQKVTGVYSNESLFPVVYLKTNGQKNKPLAFGGEDMTTQGMRAVILADSQYNLDAISSIMGDIIRTYVPLLTGSEYPFNAYGGYKTGYYNYTGLTQGKVAINQSAFIADAFVLDYSRFVRADALILNPDVHFGMVDFQLEKNRFPRL